MAITRLEIIGRNAVAHIAPTQPNKTMTRVEYMHPHVGIELLNNSHCRRITVDLTGRRVGTLSAAMSCRTDRRKVSYPWSGDPQKGGVRRVHPLSEVEERFRGRLGCHPCRVVETPPPTVPAHHGQQRLSK